ncbi:MAG: NAD(P)H-dependent oxidoreductase [Spirochaetales bacterium]|nr:NAD(P)H-dependent oxidoreductase [Spirochaetales bacterium]
MKALAVYAHPWSGSFNFAILDSVREGLSASGHEIDIIDLVKDGFNPVYSEKELALYSRGGSLDPLVKDYQARITAADYLFFIFPNWWGGVPAILKGFFDKVFLKGFAYRGEPAPGNGLLRAKSAAIITTFDSPAIAYPFMFRPHIKKNLACQMLKMNGVGKVRIFPLLNIKNIGDTKRKAFLAKIGSYAKGLK